MLNQGGWDKGLGTKIGPVGQGWDDRGILLVLSHFSTKRSNSFCIRIYIAISIALCIAAAVNAAFQANSKVLSSQTISPPISQSKRHQDTTIHSEHLYGIFK